MLLVLEKEVRDTIQAALLLKVLGLDSIINKALQAGSAQLISYLIRIFNQSLHLGYCLAYFRELTIVVLRKLGKDDYTALKLYRPIALINTIGKIIDAVIARQLSYLAKTYYVLPLTHIGGRKMRLTKHALYTITYNIYKVQSYNTRQVASLLLLNIFRAFNNVLYTRLLYNLQKR